MVSYISPDVFAVNTESLIVNFTNTKKNESVSLSGLSGYVIDINGSLIKINNQGKPKYLWIIGGDGTTEGKAPGVVGAFYITTPQRQTLWRVMKALSECRDDIDITSDNESLEIILKATYSNYCG